MAAPDHLAEPQPCARCGGSAEYDFGPIWLCLDCYYIAGSTCAGIGTPAQKDATVAGTGQTC